MENPNNEIISGEQTVEQLTALLKVYEQKKSELLKKNIEDSFKNKILESIEQKITETQKKIEELGS